MTLRIYPRVSLRFSCAASLVDSTVQTSQLSFELSSLARGWVKRPCQGNPHFFDENGAFWDYMGRPHDPIYSAEECKMNKKPLKRCCDAVSAKFGIILATFGVFRFYMYCIIIMI